MKISLFSVLSIMMLYIYGCSSIYPIQTTSYNTKLVYTKSKGEYFFNKDYVYDTNGKLAYTISKGEHFFNKDYVYDANGELAYTISKGKYFFDEDYVYDANREHAYTISKGEHFFNKDYIYKVINKKEDEPEEKKHPFFEFASL